MQISEKWLREWVDPALSTQALAHQITMAGLEVDAINPAVPIFTGVVVAEVLSTEKHPNADTLTVCQVSDGSETFQVVCGAPNVRAGLKVPFARVGAVLPGDFKIKKAKLRGEPSFGMLCGASEIGLEDLLDGLLELPAEAPVGVDIRDYLMLDDQVIDVDLTPNRADCLSVRGVAREIGALNALAVRTPDVASVPATIDDRIEIRLNTPAACPRYVGRVIRQVDVTQPSPLWLVEKLRRAGLRSVDIIVDVTNFVLLELGQPMHAFDLTKLEGGIQVRLAQTGESLTLLNGQEVTLDDSTLVIADQQKAIAIAGIMGGAATAVSAQTQDILLESAFFSPLAIAGRARRYGLHTDASHRYERGVDWQLQTLAMERATALIVALAGGQPGPVIEAVDEDNLPISHPVTLSAERANRLLALDISAGDMKSMLQRLGFSVVSTEADQWQVTAPSWRFDIEREEDLIEEVARLYGYDRLPSRLPMATPQLSRHAERQISLRQLAGLLVDRGYREAICYSFVDPDTQALLTPNLSSPALVNPISTELSVMRTSLWAGLLNAARYNMNRQVDALRLFESGLSFVERDGVLAQRKMLAGLCVGLSDPQQWQGKPRIVDFYQVKGDVEALLALTADASGYRFVAAEHTALHPGQTAAIYYQDEPVGMLGRIHPAVAKKLDVSDQIYLFELSLDAIDTAVLPAFQALSTQPLVKRDLAFVVDESVAAGEMIASIYQQQLSSLKTVRVFDVYQGDKLPAGKKSLALSLIFQHATETLKEVEINDGIDTIVSSLKQLFSAELRD